MLYIKSLSRNAIAVTTAALLAVFAAAATVAADTTAADKADVLKTLEKVESENGWAEVVLAHGSVRSIRVLSIAEDEVRVREVIGALHERPAAYALSDIRSVRELGRLRIPARRAPHRSSRSLVSSLLVELVIPGGGYFYIGESRQGFSLILFSAAAVATGFATGKDGAAGWIPLAAWVKAASLLHLADEVQAMNTSRHRSDLAAMPTDRVEAATSRISLGQLTYSF